MGSGKESKSDSRPPPVTVALQHILKNNLRNSG